MTPLHYLPTLTACARIVVHLQVQETLREEIKGLHGLNVTTKAKR